MLGGDEALRFGDEVRLGQRHISIIIVECGFEESVPVRCIAQISHHVTWSVQKISEYSPNIFQVVGGECLR
jgi:hypothetical protein